MCHEDNALSVVALRPDYLGFIFFEKTPRHVGKVENLGWIRHLPKDIKKVGVFVNELPERLLDIALELKLDAVQLHGDETPDYCEAMVNKGLEVWKAFSIEAGFSFGKTECYAAFCNYFVFDAKGPQRGGNGVPFNWQLLEHYQGNTPFLLSGGIGPEHGVLLRTIPKLYPLLAGFDLNSRFEISPGLKNPELLKTFLNEVRN